MPFWRALPEQLRNRRAHIGIAYRRRIDKAATKARTDGSHKIAGIGAAEIAVHPLALLQRVIGDGDGAHERFPQPAAKERKLITIDGTGITAEPFRLMALSGKVPGMLPNLSSTKIPLT